MKVHHLNILCRNLLDQVETFCHKLMFRPFAVLYDESEQAVISIALSRGSLRLVLCQDTCIERDTASNVAIEVRRIQSCCDMVQQHGGIVLRPCTYSMDNSFTSAVVKSPIGNIQHTLLWKNNFKGCFLPGFVSLEEFVRRYNKCSLEDENAKLEFKKLHEALAVLLDRPAKVQMKTDEKETVFLDHITFAVMPGSSFGYIDWYKKCFGFERFIMNNFEKDDGFIVNANSRNKAFKMRLLATELNYHLCSEVGCESMDDQSTEGVKFVFAESFPNQGPNQIQTFINEHGGEGLQHIALNTATIVKSTLEMKAGGVDFLVPPKCYYDEVESTVNGTHDFDRIACEKLGILIDVEEKENSECPGYLLQVFTKPVFDRKTLFFELIERHNSVGFGAGNISALWKACERYFEEQGLV